MNELFGTKEMINYPIIIAASLVFLAFVAHTFVGTREALSTRPRKLQAEDDSKAEKIERSWVQSLCAFHLVTVDLLALTLLLFFLGITDTFSARKEIAMIAAVFFTLWAAAWFIQLLALNRQPKEYLLLGQWILWFICAGLILWGAQSL